jgi:hypothetical protein
MRAEGDAPVAEPTAKPQAPPDLGEALHALGADSRAGLKAASDSFKALRILMAADFSLARSAFGRTLAFTGMAIAFGASAWLLVMGAMIAAMHSGGLSWPVAMLIAAALSIAITVGASFAAMRYFEHTRMQATRRQFARLGFGELATMMPDPGSAESSADAVQRVADATDGTPIKKGLGVDVTPP